jgi:hypothetical protein
MDKFSERNTYKSWHVRIFSFTEGRYHFKNIVKLKLQDQFLQDWHSSIDLVYRTYKNTHCFEKYLDVLPFFIGKYLCKFRTMNHLLPIEKGRHLFLMSVSSYW